MTYSRQVMTYSKTLRTQAVFPEGRNQQKVLLAKVSLIARTPIAKPTFRALPFMDRVGQDVLKRYDVLETSYDWMLYREGW